MDIKLAKGFRITSDRYNITLQKEFVGKTGEKKWKSLGYYATFEHLAEDLIDYKVRTADVDSINELIKETKKFSKEIIKNLREDEIEDIKKEVVKEAGKRDTK